MATSGPNPPDLEELLRRSQDRLKRVLPGGGGAGGAGFNPLVLIGILVLGVAFLGYNFFTFRVQPDELGIVLRFGAFERQAQPGLNFRLPYPIDQVYTPKVTRVSRVTVGQVADETGVVGQGDGPGNHDPAKRKVRSHAGSLSSERMFPPPTNIMPAPETSIENSIRCVGRVPVAGRSHSWSARSADGRSADARSADAR